MGADSDPMAVVDTALKLRGVDALRVVDASVLPDMPTGNINAAVIMAAEKQPISSAGSTQPPRPPAAPENGWIDSLLQPFMPGRLKVREAG